MPIKRKEVIRAKKTKSSKPALKIPAKFPSGKPLSPSLKKRFRRKFGKVKFV